MPSLIFRKGLDLKHAVAAEVAADYHSELVDRIKGSTHGYTSGRVTIYLAREFGFCYGVDRAIDYAYQTRRRFPDRPVYLTGEIIHNPHVNGKLRAAGIRFLSDPAEDADQLGREAVVILPAFGVEVAELEQYVRQGCTVIDTTCGSVLNVWKTVRQYAADGFTTIIHGKAHHEETRATASQTLTIPQGRYLVVLDRAEALIVCDYVRHGGEARAFDERNAVRHVVGPLRGLTTPSGRGGGQDCDGSLSQAPIWSLPTRPDNIWMSAARPGRQINARTQSRS